MHGKQITGRHIIIIDEVSPGIFDVDNQGDLHAAKVCMAALFTFKEFSKQVKEEVLYRELVNQFDAIMGIVKNPSAKPFVPPSQENIDIDLRQNIGDPPSLES